MTVHLKAGDTRTAIKATLMGPDGKPVDLTGLQVRAIMADLRGRVILARGVEITDAKAGEIRLVFEPPETDRAGTYRLEFLVRYEDARRETYPNDGYITVEITPTLEGS